jgi:glycosyltransferase involved in cell wall biosynthesis
MPRVTVVIPVYNGARWIGHALKSVFAQTFTDFEVVVVDDGSTDALDQALARWIDRIRFARQPNRGPASARNMGVRLATGSLVAFLDADDEWLPEKLALQVAYFDRYPQTGLLHTDVVHAGPCQIEADPFEPPANVFCPLFHTAFFIPTLTVMIPARVLQDVGGFDERREIHVEDWDLWLRIAARYPVGYLPRQLAVHRRGGHMSTAFEKTHAGQALVIEKNRALCALACAEHRRHPSGCLNDRQYVLHWSLAYERFKRGDRAGARRAYARAMTLRPWQLSIYGRYAACFVTDPWLARGRALKRTALRRLRRPAPEHPASGHGDRLTIASDTVYRRTRRRAANLAHAIDTSVTRALRPRRFVLFEASSPMSYGLFRPIHRRLQDDPRIEFWFTAPGRAWQPQTIFGSLGIHDRVLPASRAAWQKWDLCVNTDFFEMTNIRRRTRRVHLFHGVAGKYDLDAPVEYAREIADFECLMFPNEDRLRRYVAAGLVPADGRAAALVGYPKADALVDGTFDRQAICAALGLRPDLPVVLYAPTWSPHSSLNQQGEAIIDGLAAAGYQVVVKLHDRSYDLKPRGSGGVDWAKRLERYAGAPGVRVVREADASPLLFIADLLVTDHSSVGFEFMLLDRPLVIVDCPELIEHSRVSQSRVAQLRNAADVVRTAADLPEAVAAGLASASRHSRVRRATAEAMFYRAGTATARAISLIYQFLELPAPEVREASRGDKVFVSAASS